MWNIQQPSPLNLLATDPDFENWVAGSFAFDPGAELKGALLALHVCRHVTLFGVGLGREQGVGARYDDACGAGELSAARAAMAAERGGLEPGLDEVTAALARRWETLSALHEAGMLSFGEPCVVECRGQRGEGECAPCRAAAGLEVPELGGCPGGETPLFQGHGKPWLGVPSPPAPAQRQGDAAGEAGQGG